MTKNIKLAAAISFPLGFLSSIVFGVFSASYIAQSPYGTQGIVVIGPDAALFHIEEFGLLAWLSGLAPFALALSLVLFCGCLLYGYVHGRLS